MKRLHVHVAVDDFPASKSFYSSLFAAEPTVLKSDYAKWMLEEGQTTCCYAKSEKSWTSDPQGIAWEAFLTSAESESFGQDPELASLADGPCCTPTTPQGECCAPKSQLAADVPCCGPESSAL